MKIIAYDGGSKSSLPNFNFDNVPLELMALPQWVMWLLVERDGRTTKVLYSPKSSHYIKAKSTDPNTWGSWDDVMAAYESGKWSGIGFVFTKDTPYCGIDLDKVRNPETGVLIPEAQAVVDAFKGSYIEVSPSGSGVHIVTKGTIPFEGKGGTNKAFANGSNPDSRIEAYNHSRFFTVSGWGERVSVIAERQAQLDELYVQRLSEPVSARVSPVVNGFGPEDTQVIEKLLAEQGGKAAKLLRGDTNGYTSHSDADLALASKLAFYTDDPEQVTRIWQSSGLARDKTFRADYVERTVHKAMTTLGESYDWNRPKATTGGLVNDRRDSNDKNDNNDNDSRELLELPDAAKFPVEVLPPTTRQFVREAAASVGCPVDFVGVSALAALSAAIGDTREIHIKADWKESAALFAMIIGRPTSKKSPAMKLALRPVRERQKKLGAQYDEEWEQYKRDHKDWEQIKKNDLVEYSEPQKPIRGRTYADDTTVERLADILAENPRGLAITKDELSGWLRSMDQYKSGKGSDRQFWLSAHNNLPVVIDRKNADHPVMLTRPFVSIIGGIQPDVLPDFGKDRGDGLIERFLPCYPEPLRSRWTDDEVSQEARQAYSDTVNALYDLKHAEYEGDTFPSTVMMTPEAKEVWVEAYNASYDEVEAPGFPHRLAAVWGKLEAYTARIALILAMTRTVELRAKGQIVPERVERSDLEGAVRLIQYFKNHTRRTYTGLYGENKSDRLAQDIESFLKDQEGQVWTGIASELHAELPSDYKPERDKEFGKLIRAICKRTPSLKFEELKRTATARPFRISLETLSSLSRLSSMSSASSQEESHGSDKEDDVWEF